MMPLPLPLLVFLILVSESHISIINMWGDVGIRRPLSLVSGGTSTTWHNSSFTISLLPVHCHPRTPQGSVAESLHSVPGSPYPRWPGWENPIYPSRWVRSHLSIPTGPRTSSKTTLLGTSLGAAVIQTLDQNHVGWGEVSYAFTWL